MSLQEYLQTSTSFPLLRISVKLGTSPVILQKYHPLHVSLTTDKMCVFSLPSVELFANLLIILLHRFPELLNEGPCELKYQDTRYLSYFFVLKQQCKVRDDPDGAITLVWVLSRNTWVWPDFPTAAATTVDRKKKKCYTFCFFCFNFLFYLC